MKACLPIGVLLAAAGAAASAQNAPADAAREDARFGVMTHFAQGWDPSWIRQVADAGIPAVRDELYWDVAEPAQGRFTFSPSYDRYMSGLREAAIRPLIVLDFESRLYDHRQTPYTAEGIAAYARYAVAVLRRYGGQVKEVEIWNEYNGTFCKGPAAQDRAGTYLRMLQAAYAAIKRERPDVTVVGGATIGVPLPYWDKLLAGGALASLDALSVHPYRYNSPPEGIEADIGKLQTLVKKYGGGSARPIWVTEIGWNTKASAAPGDLAIDEAAQAKFLARAYALLFSAGASRVYWYLLHDDQGLAMGLCRNDARHAPKASYVALATLIRQLRGARFVQRDSTPRNLYSLEFERPSGVPVRVMWSLRPTTLPSSGAAEVTDLNGATRPAGPRLSLDDSPLFVTGALTGLPPAPDGGDSALADSARDFSSFQGDKGWSYGVFLGSSAAFVPLPKLQITDWKETWTGEYPYIALTATDQHPSAMGGAPVSAVRRWESNYEGTVRIDGTFQCTTQGDGVGVSVLVDGRRLFRTLLGGGKGNPIVKTFHLTQTVHPGSCIDFAVDPGPKADINFDATDVSATISTQL